MDVLALAALVIAGFTTCAEFASYAFVHPVIRRLPPQHHIAVEQGLLRTFGRAMPVLMPASVVLVVAYALDATGDGGAAAVAAWGAAVALGAATVSTVAVNVPINTATSRWDPANPPADWQRTRARGVRFPAIPAWMLLGGFVLLCAAVTSAT